MSITLNGENRFFRISIGNLISVATTIILVVGLYYKMDARIAALEKAPLGTSQWERTNVTDRISSLERKLDEVTPKIIRTDVNLLWIMSQQNTKPPPEK
jgi:hypothetical protein